MEIQDSLVDGKLPCAVAFSIAKKLEVSTRQVGDTANKLDIKINNYNQLYPLHYHDKNFLTKELIESYEICRV